LKRVASKLTFGSDIRLLMVRAVADITVESAVLVARESLSRNACSRRRDGVVHSTDRDDEPLPVQHALRSVTSVVAVALPLACFRERGPSGIDPSYDPLRTVAVGCARLAQIDAPCRINPW
jgi:hypothetical protein